MNKIIIISGGTNGLDLELVNYFEKQQDFEKRLINNKDKQPLRDLSETKQKNIK